MSEKQSVQWVYCDANAMPSQSLVTRDYKTINEYKKKDKKCLYGHNNHSQTIDSAITRVVVVNDEEKH